MSNIIKHLKKAISFEINREGAVLRRFGPTYTVKRLRLDIGRFVPVYDGEDEEQAIKALEEAIEQYAREAEEQHGVTK